MKDKNSNRKTLSFDLMWGFVGSAISVMLSVGCYVNYSNEWFLLLGTLAGSSFFSLLKVWKELKKPNE